jgi:hypothetical protein
MLCENDWANTGLRYYKCLTALGLRGLAFKGAFHTFYYPEQMVIHPAIYEKTKNNGNKIYVKIDVPELKNVAEAAKVIHFRDSVFVNTGIDLSKKKVVVQHGGRLYRQYHENLNAMFNPVADASLIHMADLMNLGAKNEHLMYFPVDTDYIKPQFKRQSLKLQIGHWPTSQIEKGSQMITEVVRRLEKKYPDRFDYLGVEKFEFAGNEVVIWDVNLQRMKYCDIVIDAVAMTAQGHPYGEWGNTAVEAAACGSIVITHSRLPEYYEMEFPIRSGYYPNPMHIANTEDQLEEKLSMLLELSDFEIEEEKQRHRAWVEQNHSIPATAKRLWNKVYKGLI